jgi:hypothetical protein
LTTERTCPHCGAVVPPERNLCPQCARPVPVPEPPSGHPPVAEQPAVPGLSPVPGQPVASAYTQPPPAPGYYQPPVAPAPGYYAPPPYGAPPPPPPDDTLAIIGLVLGIVGILCCGCLSILCPVGLIMALIAYHRRPSGVGLAAVIVGIVGTVIFLAVTAWSLYLMAHPDVQRQMIEQTFRQMGMPVPPGFPMP